MPPTTMEWQIEIDAEATYKELTSRNKNRSRGEGVLERPSMREKHFAASAAERIKNPSARSKKRPR
jgi:hypothetical protein